MRMLLGFSHDNCVGVAPIVIPLKENEVHSVQATGIVRISVLIVFFINLVYLKAI